MSDSRSNGSDSSGMKALFTPPGEEQCSPESLSEANRNIKYVEK